MPEWQKEMVAKVVELGQVIRRHRAEGNLLSVAPPTIYGYLAFLRMVRAMPHLSLVQVAQSTLLGNASGEDQKHIASVLGEVFGLRKDESDDPILGPNLF